MRVHGCTVILKPNRIDHMGHSYKTWVTKTRGLIMHNTSYIWNTAISKEHYLWEQIRMATGQMEDVFVQAGPAEANKMPKLCVTTGWRSHGTKLRCTRRGRIGRVHPLYNRIQGSVMDAQGTLPLPTEQTGMANPRCDRKPDHTTVVKVQNGLL